MDYFLGLVAIVILIFIIWYINHLYLKYKRYRVIRLFRKHPTGLKLLMLNDDAFTYYDKIIKSKSHNRDYILSTSEEIIKNDFSIRQCNVVLSFPLDKLYIWEKDYEYMLDILHNYPDGLFKYIVDNEIIESFAILPDSPLKEHDIEKYRPDNLHKLASVSTFTYRKIDEEEKEVFNIPNIKSDATDIVDYIKANGIKYVYHTTHMSNIESIISNGGLFSWVSSKVRGISINKPGGNNLSNFLDVRNNVADYVHLSFARFHPMFEKNECDRNNYITLKIHPVVLLFENTLFSTENATSSSTIIGGDITTLRMIDYKTTQLGLYKNDHRYGVTQAEILVKGFIPLKYIVNIERIKRISKIKC